MDEKVREYNKNQVFIPDEKHIEGTKYSGFRTHDNEVYIRNEFTGEIRSHQKKVKGKRARKLAKIARRTAK